VLDESQIAGIAQRFHAKLGRLAGRSRRALRPPCARPGGDPGKLTETNATPLSGATSAGCLAVCNARLLVLPAERVKARRVQSRRVNFRYA
jgi:hypothetical protein